MEIIGVCVAIPVLATMLGTFIAMLLCLIPLVLWVVYTAFPTSWIGIKIKDLGNYVDRKMLENYDRNH